MATEERSYLISFNNNKTMFHQSQHFEFPDINPKFLTYSFGGNISHRCFVLVFACPILNLISYCIWRCQEVGLSIWYSVGLMNISGTNIWYNHRSNTFWSALSKYFHIYIFAIWMTRLSNAKNLPLWVLLFRSQCMIFWQPLFQVILSPTP